MDIYENERIYDDLMQQRRNSSMLVMELHCFYITPLMFVHWYALSVATKCWQCQQMMSSHGKTSHFTGPFWEESPVITSGFSSQRPVMWTFNGSIDSNLNKFCGKELSGWFIWHQFNVHCTWQTCVKGGEWQTRPVFAILHLSHMDSIWPLTCSSFGASTWYHQKT